MSQVLISFHFLWDPLPQIKSWDEQLLIPSLFLTFSLSLQSVWAESPYTVPSPYGPRPYFLLSLLNKRDISHSLLFHSQPEKRILLFSSFLLLCREVISLLSSPCAATGMGLSPFLRTVPLHLIAVVAANSSPAETETPKTADGAPEVR